VTLPTYEALMLPLLRALRDGQPHRISEVARDLAVELGIEEEQMAELLPSGKVTVWRSRTQWASQYLSQAGAITRTQRGVFVISERGRKLLAEHPGGLGRSDLLQFPEFVDFTTRRRPGEDPTPAPELPTLAAGTSPQERLEVAAAEVNDTVAAELLQRINEQLPEFLEKVVLQLLVAMGYAGSLGRADHLGGSGDEGVDGVVRQDALGLDRIYVQAKRYSSGRVVGRPDIQAFVGALQGAQATRGVYITTSRFSVDGLEYADRVAQRVVLIDGAELTRLMVEHGVGVQTDQTFVLSRVDEDFFEA